MPDPAPPRYLSVPPYAETDGDLAVRVGEQLGLPPDVSQRLALDAIYAVEADGEPVAFEVALVCARQNLKTATLEVAALTDLFALRVPLHIWTAHLFSTARKTFEHMIEAIDRNADFRRLCKPPRTANGSEAIELRTGERIEFYARSKGGGRGLTGDRVTLDEALFLTSAEVGAVVPTMATRPGAQVRYGSSAGILTSETLRGIRARGRAGNDPSLAYLEWTAERRPCLREDCRHKPGEAIGCALDDRELWWQGNPALGLRLTESRLASFRRAMPPEEFAREFLSWWDDPPTEDGAVVDPAVWASLAVADASELTPLAFAVDVTPDRRYASIALAGRRPDGRVQVEVVETGSGTGWIVDRLVGLVERRDPCAVVLDRSSPAASLLPELAGRRIEPHTTTAAEMAQAFGVFYDDVTGSTPRLVHTGDPDLTAALESARTRDLAGGKAWTRKGAANITPLVAVTLARLGLQLYGGRLAPPAPVLVTSGGTRITGDLMRAGF